VRSARRGAAAWRKSIEVFDEDAGHSQTLALFPEDRATAAASDSSAVQLRLSEMRQCRPRQWGACWLAGQLRIELQLDWFWARFARGFRRSWMEW
jgi:hypothetical protein